MVRLAAGFRVLKMPSVAEANMEKVRTFKSLGLAR